MIHIPTPRALGEPATLLSPPELGEDGRWRFAPVPSALLVPLALPADPEGPGVWEAPRLHLCPDDAALLGVVLGVQALPAQGDGEGLEVPLGALALRGPQAEPWRQALAAALGLGRVGPGQGYLVLVVERLASRAVHEGFAAELGGRFDRERHLSAAGKRAMARLAGYVPGPPPTAARRLQEAQGSLELLRGFGSHFVSAVRFGDRLLQAIGLEGEAWEALAAAWATRVGAGPAEGRAALAWAAAATPRPGVQVGSILSVAGDPALAEQRAQGMYHDGHQLHADSLFWPFQQGLAQVQAALGPLRACAPIGLELTPTSRALERYRSLGVARITRAALALRCGPALRCALPRSPLAPPPPEVARVPARPVGAASLRGTWQPADGLGPGVICTREATLRGPGQTRAAGGGAWLVAQRLLGAANTADLHTIVWEEGESLRLLAQDMEGGLRLHGPEGEELVLDGLRLGLDAGSGAVTVRGELGLADAAEREALRPALEAALVAALCPVAVEGARVRHDEGLAAWLAPLLPEGEALEREVLAGVARGHADPGPDAAALPAGLVTALGRLAGSLAGSGPDPARARQTLAAGEAALHAAQHELLTRLATARAALDAAVYDLREAASDEERALTLDILQLPVELGAPLPRHLASALRPGGLRPRPPPGWLVAQVELPLALRELALAAAPAAPGLAPPPAPRIPPEAWDRHLHLLSAALRAWEGVDTRPLLQALAVWLGLARTLCQLWRVGAQRRLAGLRLALLERVLRRGDAPELGQALWSWTLAEALADQNAALQHAGEHIEASVPARPLALAHALTRQAASATLRA